MAIDCCRGAALGEGSPGAGNGNLVLRQQLAVYKQGGQRPQLTDADRRFWAVISSIWSRWRNALNTVQPETVIRWHRRGFRCFWGRKCVKHGRPPIDPRIKALIHQMCTVNPLWGAPRIHGELLKLGIDVSGRVSRRAGALSVAAYAAFAIGGYLIYGAGPAQAG